MNKKWMWAGVAVAIIGAAVYSQRVPLSMALVEKMVSERMQDPLASLPDGLHVGLCGTGSPFPDPQRSAPCTLVIAGKQMLLFDAGSGAAKQIARMGFSSGQLNAVFLTHFHSDHIDGLGEIMMTRWAQQTSGQPLALYGPSGVDEVAHGFEQAYAHDTSYRTAHHGEALMPKALSGAEVHRFEPPPSASVEVYNRNGLVVKAIAVDHGPVHPAVGYLIQYKDRSVVLSGDTKPSLNLQTQARGADLLIHEALSTELVGTLDQIAARSGKAKLAQIFKDIQNYHTTPAQVAELAKQAQVKEVVLSHIVPPLPLPPMKEVFLGNAPAAFGGPFRIGEDGDLISLPAHRKTIEHTRRWTR